MSTSDSLSSVADTVSGEDPGRPSGHVTRRPSLLGARMAAVIIDGLVLLVPVLTVAWLLSLAFPHHGFFFSKSGVSVSSTGATTTNHRLRLPGFLVISALSLSYFFLFEALRGQTIGKRAMGLRVRCASGGRPGLNAVSARTVLRLIDALPFFYLLGTLVALLSGPRRRRIGDWAGRTVVVHDEGVADDPPQRARWRATLYPALWLFAALFATFALGLGKTAGQSEKAFAQHPPCWAAGISTPEGREGVCVRISGSAGQTTTYNVVDRRHALRMPEYEAHLLGSQITPTHVTNHAENEALYPHGQGQLVSFRVVITNTGSAPLPFGSRVATRATPSYPAHPLMELALPSSPGAGADVGFPAILNGRRAPTPSVFEQPPIAPHRHLIGWVTFVAPAWSLRVLDARPADVDFFRSNGSSDYIGQIRLWK
jgi:uncharacterized RDD family membrane protein YckC